MSNAQKLFGETETVKVVKIIGVGQNKGRKPYALNTIYKNMKLIVNINGEDREAEVYDHLSSLRKRVSWEDLILHVPEMLGANVNNSRVRITAKALGQWVANAKKKAKAAKKNEIIAPSP